MHFLQAINSDLSVLIACNKIGGTIEGDIKKNLQAFVEKGRVRRPVATSWHSSRVAVTFTDFA